MTTKRTKGKFLSSSHLYVNVLLYTIGFASLDLVLPVAPHYRTDPQVLKDVEKMRTNAASRWAKYEFAQAPSGFNNNNNNNNDNDNSSKISTLARPKVEILRANSPTLKRLLAARIKLEKYANLTGRVTSASRQSIRSIRQTPYPIDYEKQSSVLSKPVHEKQSSILTKSTQIPSQPTPHPIKQIKPQSSLDNGPLDKITYEKTWTRNGNIKQKCSLEIWLPKAGLDDDDGTTTRTATPDMKTNEKNSQTIPIIKSRRSSIAKITATTTITNIEAKSLDELSSKKSEPVVIPRVYHYGDYIMDIPEERPRSSKSVTTVKSDGTGSIKSIRRQHSRPHTGRQSISTHHSEEILRFGTIEVPTSAKNLSIHTKSASSNHEIKPTIKSTNPAMINELMQKYSLIKQNHQELIQTKLQLEKPNNDSKHNANTIKDHSPRPRPPPVPDSTLLVSSDHPTVSVKKLLIDTSVSRVTNDHNNTNTKLLDRRSSPRKSSHPDMYPQLRIFSLANQKQHRQPSANGSVSNAAHLPNVNGKKPDDTQRVLQRSKTLDVILDIPTSVNVSSRAPTQADNLSSNRIHRTTNGILEQTPSHMSNRSSLNLYSEHKKQQQHRLSIIQNSRQNYHRSTTTTTTATTNVSTNKVLVHFNHSNNGNMDHNGLVPE
ncbi:unnamed protein product [Rotaria sordida]|uniref:Uncharacterized protein n=1 Tax=Rotaria sordida TaxID=392033 RepID=A0A814U2V4_9BILA|nr:unnamed protein product [Rotaria sordida]CAF1168823.1 unnamed protein product [Rotaria sordida]CAF3629095.1 unnamed protein product [Rotaria sordida]CAF3702341.1 unnamed protein product [Rotaria sordida]